MAKKLIIFPFGGNAREALACIFDINTVKKSWDVVGFIDDDSSCHGKSCCAVKVLGGSSALAKFPDAMVLAVPGSPDNYLKREEIIGSLGVDRSKFAAIIHPSAVIASGARVGYNTLIMPNVVVGCASSVGNHCVVLPNTVLGHDSVISDYCCIGANVTISGGVIAEKGCYIGSASSISDNIRIGEQSLVGIGSNVINDIGRHAIAAGNPARIIREVVR